MYSNMLSLLGCLLLLSKVSSIFVFSNTSHNFTITTTNPTLEWQENGSPILTLIYDSASDGCYPYPPQPGFNGYCIDNGATYVLEILNTSNHDKSVFTGGNKICVIETEIPVIHVSSDELKPDKPVKIEVGVSNTKPKPGVKLSLINRGLKKNVYIEENSSCADLIMNYSLSHELTFPETKKLFGDEEMNITVNAVLYFGDINNNGEPSRSISFYFNPGGPPSTPPTPSASTSLQPTSSAQNPSTKVSSESSTSTTPTPTPKCEDLICVCDQICIIIICVCVGSLIIIVVIILCCCCCPFCLCYKRRKKKSEGTECKCCGLICVCCRPNNKDHDEESEGRAKVCESCCCLFCVCYKRKKKSGDRNSNPNKKKSASRSQQYEMPRTNHPDGMHSYSGYQVNRPDERARVNQPADMNYNISRPDQPARVYQPADMNYHVLRPDQQARVYQPSPATGFTPNDSRYGQGYNNAAYIHHGENERRRNVDRKLHVTQRPYTKHY